MTAVWRRAAGWTLLSSAGVFAREGYWSLDEGWASPRAGRPGGVPAASRTSAPPPPSDQPAGAGRSGSSDAARGKWPRLPAGGSQPGAPGGGAAAWVREIRGVAESRARLRPSEHPGRPLRGPWGQGRGQSASPPRSPRTRPLPTSARRTRAHALFAVMAAPVLAPRWPPGQPR